MFDIHAFPSTSWPQIHQQTLTGASVPAGRPASVWHAYLELCRTERMSREEIVRGTWKQLTEVLKHATAFVPHYADAFAGLRPGVHELKDYPILSRQELAENRERLLARRLPAGQILMGENHTAGSTGVPVTVAKTNLTQLWHDAMFLRQLHWGELDPQKRFAAIRYYPPEVARELQNGLRVPYLHPAFAEVIKSEPAFVMDIHVDPEKQFEWLLQIKPDYLLSFPSNLAALAQISRAKGKQLVLECVLSISETLTEEVQEAIASTFDCDVINCYSSNEVGYIAAPCRRNGAHLHVFSENVIVEIVDPETHAPLAIGDGEGKVLITTLQNFAQPLIRYDIGDRATKAADCQCGRNLPFILRPSGKALPLFKLRDGTRKNSMALAVMMRKVGGTLQWRITQKSALGLLVEVVPGAKWGPERRMEIEQHLVEFMGAPVTVHFAEYPHRLPLNLGGKSTALVTEI